MAHGCVMNWPKVVKCYCCGSVGRIYDRRDSITGWMGWCEICNMHWHYPFLGQNQRLQLIYSWKLPGHVHLLIFDFLGLAELQKKLGNLQWKALYYIWRRVLLGRFHRIYWPCKNYDKTNRLWWLFRVRRSTLLLPHMEQWSSGLELPEDRECPFRIGRPLRIVVRFLGHKTNRAFFNGAKSRRITCCWRNMLLALLLSLGG